MVFSAAYVTREESLQGKREVKAEDDMRAPAVLLLLAAMSVLLTTVGPRGVAADSPLSSPAEPVLEEQPESTATEVRTMPEETAGQDVEAAEKPDTQPFSPVPESGPVEDTYFDDAKEVATGLECGISLVNCNDIQAGDIIETFTEIEVEQKL